MRFRVCVTRVACRVCTAVEECRNPSLRGQPLAVTQKYLVVTANYPARAAGVTK
jgi:nucleotidyltransferase/DNA polymerase involved in DNA repair